MSKVLIVAPLSSLKIRTRLRKVALLLLQREFDVEFWGWEREKGELRDNSWGGDIKESAILFGGGYGSRGVHMRYPLWLASVFFNVLFRAKGRVIYCLGWETAFPAVLASFFRSVQIVFDDADRFSMLANFPKPIARIIVGLEKWTSKRAFIHIVPNLERYDWSSPNMIVIKNNPLQEDLPSDHKRERGAYEGKFVVYVNGWVGETRGAPIFLKVMKQILESGLKVEMHIAGRIDSSSGLELINLPNVIYHGVVSQKEALEVYTFSDIVLTYYDPIVEINNFAESNKWGDCISCGVPFVVNSEVKTAAQYVLDGVAFSFNYQDWLGLCNFIVAQCQGDIELECAREKIRSMRGSIKTFEGQFGSVIEMIARAGA